MTTKWMTTKIKKLRKKIGNLRHDKSGAFSMIYAICTATLVAVIGAALDYSLLTHSNARAQSIADITALSAAIYVKNNEITPTNRDEGLIGNYTAEELGYDFKNWVIGGEQGVNINVSYNEIEREAIVTASGKTRPIFVQLFGHTELDFNTQTVVKFFEKLPVDPASVALVLDNSGSMFWDDTPLDQNGNKVAGTQRRIDGLISSANNFMDLLDATVGPQDGSDGQSRVLRTGMMAFSTDIIPSRTVAMNWGTIANSAIDNMVPDGATNSAPPLAVADTWLNINEPPVHELENPGSDPLKYIILMTDGRNTVGLEEWVAREGTENWRAWLQTGTRTEFRTETTTTTETESYIVNAFVNNANCRIEGGYPREIYRYNGRNFNTTRRVLCDREVDVTTTVQVPFEVPEFDWVYREQEDEPLESGNWEEGEFDISSNIATREQCDSLHADNVEVFSIAYALTPGHYITNDWGRIFFGNNNLTRETTEEDGNKARAILQYCASKAENFITADNTEALEAAFDRIGQTIVQEIIRIDS